MLRQHAAWCDQPGHTAAALGYVLGADAAVVREKGPKIVRVRSASPNPSPNPNSDPDPDPNPTPNPNQVRSMCSDKIGLLATNAVMVLASTLSPTLTLALTLTLPLTLTRSSPRCYPQP